MGAVLSAGDARGPTARRPAPREVAVPESRKRKKSAYTPPPTPRKQDPVKLESPRWLPVVMVACFLIGLLWIVAWYVADNPLQDNLGGWNVAIGFAFIGVGFILSTRWR